MYEFEFQCCVPSASCAASHVVVCTQYICTAHENSLKVSCAGSANVRFHLNSNGARLQQQRDESDVQRK